MWQGPGLGAATSEWIVVLTSRWPPALVHNTVPQQRL